MGFRKDEARSALMEVELGQSTTLDEAANILLEKTNPEPSFFDNLVEWFTGPSEEDVHLPGKYRIECERVTLNLSPRPGRRGEEQLHHLTRGQEVDVVEIKEIQEYGVVRGRMADGQWISLAPTDGDATWTRRISLAEQLMALGFPPLDAHEAAKRCSTVEGAVDFLANPRHVQQ